MKAKGIIIVIFVLIAIIIIAQNTEVMPIQLLFWRLWMSRIVLIILMLALGFGIGFILAKITTRKHSTSKKQTT
jgi:uncharacterized integral membrane protein